MLVNSGAKVVIFCKLPKILSNFLVGLAQRRALLLVCVGHDTPLGDFPLGNAAGL